MKRLTALRLLVGGLAGAIAAPGLTRALQAKEQAFTAEILAPATPAAAGLANFPAELAAIFQTNFLERKFEESISGSPLSRLRSNRTVTYTEVRHGIKLS